MITKNSRILKYLPFAGQFIVVILCLPVIYSYLLYNSVKLKREGFYLCWKCWGTGADDAYSSCPECKGEGKVDWIQRIVKS